MRKRILSLKQLLVFIETINSQISFSKKTIQEIIENISLKEEMKLKIICELSENKSNRLRSYQALGLCVGAALAILFV